MRTKNSIKNIIAAMSSNIVTIIVGLIAQAIFIKILGTEYLGLNGLFTNIISMLAIVELGVGNAIIYNLYQPIATKNVQKIKSLMHFYKKSYRIIGFVILLLGLILIPFLPLLIEEVTININITGVFLLFLIETVCSYFLSYKRSILYANQKNYLIQLIHIAYTILLNTLQLFILYFTKNYYLYLIIKILMRILENIVITLVANKLYSYLKENDVKELDKETEKDIFKKVKALFFHKIGGFVVLGTDNIIISKYLGLVSVGLYSNYYLIINAVQTLFGQMIIALTPSVGDMLVGEQEEKIFDTFKKIRFINFWIATFTGISLLILMEPFIKLWIGDEFLLSFSVLIVLVFNYFQKMMRNTYQTFKEAAGIFYEDRFVPLVESALNIIVSILLVKYLGLVGVFIGTIISGMVLWGYSYPKYVYKNLFKRSYLNYIKETIGYLLLFISIASMTYLLSSIIHFNQIYLTFIVNLLISLFIPNLLLLLFFYKTEHFKYFKTIINKIIKKEKNI